jgi:hypothetical protein
MLIIQGWDCLPVSPEVLPLQHFHFNEHCTWPIVAGGDTAAAVSRDRVTARKSAGGLSLDNHVCLANGTRLDGGP